MMELPPGSVVGDYVVERTLGRGGMGSVYAVRHTSSGLERAVKVLGGPQSGLRAEVRRERFAREARALAKLDRHPNVVGVHDAGVLPDGRSYCVLDYVDGGDLDGLLAARTGPLGVEQVLSIGAGVARALEHIHAQGVVHRDLKPGNVLLSQEATPILTDFGIARDEAEERLTRTQAVMGTPQYMSPEQATGATDQIGPPTDVFALGVVLYQLLAGELPFEGDNSIELTRAILCDEPTPLSSSREDLPRGLQQLIQLCLDKQATRRPSAADVAEALERLARGESIHLRPPSGLGRFARGVVDRRLLVGLALAGVVGITAVAHWGGEWIARSRAEAAGLREVQGALQSSREARLEFSHWGRTPQGGAEEHLTALVRADLQLAQLQERPALSAEALADLGQERGRVAQALALVRAEQALLRGDLAQARAALQGQSSDAALLPRAELALRSGQAEEATRLLARASAGARHSRLSAWVEAEAAVAAGARCDGPAAAAAVRRAQALHAGQGARALSASIEAVVGSWEQKRDSIPRALKALEALRTSFGEERFPSSASRVYLAAARRAQRARDYAPLTRWLSLAATIDPRLPLPREMATALVLEGKGLVRAGQTAKGFGLLLHASRSGYETFGKNLLRQLHQQGALDHAVESAPTDWAPRYWRLRATVSNTSGREFTPKVYQQCRSDLLHLLGSSKLPRWVRVEVQLEEVQLEVLNQTLEAALSKALALTNSDFPDPRRAYMAASSAAAHLKRVPLALELARKGLAAFDARALLGRDELPEGGTLIVAVNRKRVAIYVRILLLLIQAKRLDEAERWLAQMSVRAPQPYLQHELRARLLKARGQYRKALAEIELGLELDPRNRHGLQVRETIRALVERKGAR